MRHGRTHAHRRGAAFRLCAAWHTHEIVSGLCGMVAVINSAGGKLKAFDV